MRPRCASRVLAIGGAHLLSAPRSRAGPVGAAQRDRVPEMPPRRLVASALICPIVKLPVRSLRRRHLHPYPCRLPSRSGPARCRLLHDFAHTMSRSKALTPLAPGRASAARCGHTTRSRVPVRPFLGDACDRRGTRGWGSPSHVRGEAPQVVRGGAPQVEPKTRTAKALLVRVVADLHTRTPRSNSPAPLCPARSRQDCCGGGVSPSMPGLVTFYG
jgi:hypothetical protein